MKIVEKLALIAPTVFFLLVLPPSDVVGQPFMADTRCLQGNRALSSDLHLEKDDVVGASRAVDLVPSSSPPLASPGPLRGNRESKAQNVFRFNLRLYWEQGYCWQEEWIERRWCMACQGKICNENDQLWIIDCNENVPQQQFVWKEDVNTGIGNGGRLSPYSRLDLCWERVTDANDFFEFKLKPCDYTERRQILVGFDTSKPFELHPFGLPEFCMTQDHDPKREELVYREPCSIAREDFTSLWVVEGGSNMAPISVAPTSESCQYDALLKGNERLGMNERRQIKHPIEAYIIMQEDGNLIVWRGTPQARGSLLWKSGVSFPPRQEDQYTTQLQRDAHLLTWRLRNDGSGRRSFVFRSFSPSKQGDYFLAVNCDRKTLSIFRQEDDGTLESVWTTEPR